MHAVDGCFYAMAEMGSVTKTAGFTKSKILTTWAVTDRAADP